MDHRKPLKPGQTRVRALGQGDDFNVTPANSNTRVSTGRLPVQRPGAGPFLASPPTLSNSNTRLLTRPGPSSVPETPVPRAGSLNSDRLRDVMVGRLKKQGIHDDVVLAAMRAVPRHVFVDEGLASRAYDDAALPIGLGQTISQPWVVARMTAALRESGGPLERVLEVGTGCGYQAAVLAQVAKAVYSIERIRPLHELARKNLRPFRLPHLRLVFGDGMLGLPSAAPFDAILIAAAGLEIPHALLEQLALGGRLIAPEGGAVQKLVLIERTGPSKWVRSEHEAVRFVPLKPGVVMS